MNIILFSHPTKKKLLYGTVHEVNVQANVTNLGEPAYQARIQMNFTSDLEVIGVDINGVCLSFFFNSISKRFIFIDSMCNMWKEECLP